MHSNNHVKTLVTKPIFDWSLLENDLLDTKNALFVSQEKGQKTVQFAHLICAFFSWKKLYDVFFLSFIM